MLPETDPFPLATDWQALARLVATLHHGKSYGPAMADCYFSHPLPQTLHALVYSVMSGTPHTNLAFFRQLRKDPRSTILDVERLPNFRADNYLDDGPAGKYKGNFSKAFKAEVVPYFEQRILSQSGCKLFIDHLEEDLVFATTKTGEVPKPGSYGCHDPIKEIANGRQKELRFKVLRFLVNNVVFSTLISNGFTNTAKILYRLLVRDYNVPESFLARHCEFNTVSGNKRDLIGERFGHLYVVGKSTVRKSGGHILWNTVCDCGRPVSDIPTSDLTLWRAFSCGECGRLKTVQEKSSLKAAKARADRAQSNALTTATSRAIKYAEAQSSKAFYKSEETDIDKYLVDAKKRHRAELYMLASGIPITAVAGLPLYAEGNKLDLHRFGHETMIADSVSMPYAASTICWVLADANKKHEGDSCLSPYADPVVDIALEAAAN